MTKKDWFNAIVFALIINGLILGGMVLEYS